VHKFEPEMKEKSYSFNIYALKDNKSYIVNRYSNYENNRFYFVRENNKRKYIGYLNTDYCYLIENNNEVPRVEVWDYNYKTFMGKLFQDHFFVKDVEEIEYRIYIPENSITDDFTIDLE